MVIFYCYGTFLNPNYSKEFPDPIKCDRSDVSTVQSLTGRDPVHLPSKSEPVPY